MNVYNHPIPYLIMLQPTLSACPGHNSVVIFPQKVITTSLTPVSSTDTSTIPLIPPLLFHGGRSATLGAA